MTIEKRKLLEAIRTVLPAVARKELFDQADKLAIDDGHLVAYNDEIAIIQPVPELEGVSGVIDGRKLFELLSRIPDEVEGALVVLDVAVASSELTVSSRQVRTRASFLLSERGMSISEVDQTGEWITLPEKFTAQLGMVASACARVMNRPVLTCVRFANDVVEASDGYRMARFRSGAEVPRLLLPMKAAELVADSAVSEMALGGSGEWVRFRSQAGTIICARTVTGDYPPIGDLYDVPGSPIVLPIGLRESVDRAQVFARRDLKINEEIQVVMSPGKIVVRAGYDGGRFSETVVHRGQKSEASFSIHPRFLLAALEDGAECVLGKSKIKFSMSTWEHVIALR